MAAAISGISRFGRLLGDSEPGPRGIRSACLIASLALGSAQTRRRAAICGAEAGGTGAVIRGGDDGSEIGDAALGAGVLVGAAKHVFFQGAEERGEAGAAAEGNNAEAAGKRVWFGGALFHTGIRN